MIDRIFASALTFCVLVGGTVAIGTALFGTDQRPAPRGAHVRSVELEPVVITCKTFAAASTVATVDQAGASARPL